MLKITTSNNGFIFFIAYLLWPSLKFDTSEDTTTGGGESLHDGSWYPKPDSRTRRVCSYSQTKYICYSLANSVRPWKTLQSLRISCYSFNPIWPIWEVLKQNLFESVIYNFLTLLKYVYTLTSNLKNCHLYPDRRAERGFKLASQDMLCIFWTNLQFFWVLFIFYHVRCINIHNFGHWSK